MEDVTDNPKVKKALSPRGRADYAVLSNLANTPPIMSAEIDVIGAYLVYELDRLLAKSESCRAGAAVGTPVK